MTDKKITLCLAVNDISVNDIREFESSHLSQAVRSLLPVPHGGIDKFDAFHT